MRFANKQSKLDWLKATADKIREMEHNRRVAILRKDFQKAYSLLQGIEFAKREFKKVSLTLRH